MAGGDATTSAALHSWTQFRTDAAPALSRFRASLDDPRAAQQRRLRQLLDANADCEFGRQHGFASIASIDAFRRQVPVAGWQDVAPWVERAQREPVSPLTTQPPLFFEPTSGSGAASKRIPMTRDLLREFQSAIVPWLASLAESCPAIATGRSYWALSPVIAAPASTPNGLAVGGAGDSAYLAGSCAQALLPTVLNPLNSGDDAQRWRDATLAALIAADDLVMISVWSPTFLLSLLRPLLDASTAALRDPNWYRRLDSERQRAVRHALDAGDPGTLWPRLAVVSCWMDGPSAAYAETLQRHFPRVRFLPKGLLATEGVVSTSWGASGRCPLAVQSHFLEFEDDDARTWLADELSDGGRYRPLLTTGGGLYRYRLGDIVEVDGFVGRTPCIRFVGRHDARSDLVGEKLDAALVSAALGDLADRGAVVVPVRDAATPYYLLLVDGDCDAATGERVERALLDVHHYRQARRLGQLGPLQTRCVTGCGDLLQHAWEAAGRRAGDAKPAALIGAPDHARAILAHLEGGRPDL